MSLGAKPQQQVSEVPMGSPEEYPRQDGLWPTLTVNLKWREDVASAKSPLPVPH
jgi:hypothetical protein